MASGDAKKHILAYLQEFLFAPERARTQVKFLSGGERNSILLAKLFTKKANVIVLDEPTNDLDTETLEMLEQRLVSFPGTVLLVSHDREFINNVVTSCLVFEDGNVKEYFGGYDDWVRQRPQIEKPERLQTKETTKAAAPTNKKPKKLSFNQKRELEQLPGMIESLEGQIAELHTAMADPNFHQQSGDTIASVQKQLKALEQQLAEYYERWEQLEELNV